MYAPLAAALRVPRAVPRRVASSSRTREGETDGETASEVWRRWSPSSLALGSPHPGPLVEAATLADVRLPPLSFDPRETLARQIESGTLSDAQLEGVAYACARHLRSLPVSGERAGFYLGDGAGVGKGRQIAGIAYDSAARGRSRHVWLSAAADLYLDATRDVREIGCALPIVPNAAALRATDVEGILFATYTTLASSAILADGRTRYDQIVDWLAGGSPRAAFDGVIALDECHRAQNLVEDDPCKSTKTGLAVLRLQRDLPLARVVYASATGVCAADKMGYMVRLGLWGPGTNFESFASFANAAAGSARNQSVAGLEMLALHLKGIGAQVSRNVGFEGAEFETLVAEIDAPSARVYRSASVLWRDLMTTKLAQVGGSLSREEAAAYWSAHLRFFRQLVVCLKLPALVVRARRALAEGHCVVVGLQTTGEASLARDENSPGFVSVCASVAKLYAERNLAPSPERTELVARAGAAGFPLGALDALIDAFGGASNVAEMTGRAARRVRGPDGAVSLEKRSAGGAASPNAAERDAFNRGDKLVAVVSKAASTGFSLHADRGFRNTRRRHHFTLELPWAADSAIQQLGRSHRANQTSAPVFVLTSSGLGGETRFVAAVARRLAGLGAAAQGDRRASLGAASLGEAAIYESKYGREALSRAKAVSQHAMPSTFDWRETVRRSRAALAADEGFVPTSFAETAFVVESAVAEIGSGATNVRRFLNRTLGLPVARQAILFECFDLLVAAAIRKAKVSGKYEPEAIRLVGRAIVRAAPAKLLGGEPSDGTAVYLHEFERDRGLSFFEAIRECRYRAAARSDATVSREAFPVVESLPSTAEFASLCSARAGFFAARGRGIVLGFRVGEGPWTLSTPSTGSGSSRTLDDDGLTALYSRVVDVGVAAKTWTTAFASGECSHGPRCKFGADCGVGTRRKNHRVLSGALLPRWAELASAQLNEAHGPRIVRVETTDARERVVGIEWPARVPLDVAALFAPAEQLPVAISASSPVDAVAASRIACEPFTPSADRVAKRGRRESESSSESSEE